MNVFYKCQNIENDKFFLRSVQDEDLEDLLKVYSDKNALPFFNSDNCDGDNFYYSSKNKMQSAMNFWKQSYEKGWFVRYSIVDKKVKTVIGTVELCIRKSEDAFNDNAILRVDVRSDYEQENHLYEIFSLIAPREESMLGCKVVATKAPIYAVERIKAIQNAGFIKSCNLLIGKNGYHYDGYWTYELHLHSCR